MVHRLLVATIFRFFSSNYLDLYIRLLGNEEMVDNALSDICCR